MSQLRLNPLTGRWVAIATERASRPGDFAPPPRAARARTCTARSARATRRRRLRRSRPTAAAASGSSGWCRTSTRPSRGRATSRSRTSARCSTRPPAPASTRCWCSAPTTGPAGPTSTTSRSVWSSPPSATAWRTTPSRPRSATRRRSSTTAARPGASLEHPHGQLLGIPFVPDELQAELDGLRRPTTSRACCAPRSPRRRPPDTGSCCADERVVVVCPFWSATPYEMLILPRHHEAHLAHAAPADLVSMSRAVRDSLAALVRLVGRRRLQPRVPHRAAPQRPTASTGTCTCCPV